MTDQDQHPTLAKIRALLAKAEDPAATPEEAETYTTKAAELMAKYGIDRAMLAAADPTSDIPGDKVVIVDPPYALDKVELLGGVAQSFRCRVVVRTTYPAPTYKKQISAHLFGFASDLERVELLYTSLLVQTANALAQTPVPPWENTAAFRRSFFDGFTTTVVMRLHAAERRAEQQADEQRTSGPSAALVLADRTAVVDRRVAERYPRLRKAPPRQLSGGGFAEGADAGRNADLGGARLERSRRAIDGGS